MSHLYEHNNWLFILSRFWRGGGRYLENRFSDKINVCFTLVIFTQCQNGEMPHLGHDSQSEIVGSFVYSYELNFAHLKKKDPFAHLPLCKNPPLAPPRFRGEAFNLIYIIVFTFVHNYDYYWNTHASHLRVLYTILRRSDYKCLAQTVALTMLLLTIILTTWRLRPFC